MGEKRQKMNLSELPISSSLGMLAEGDVVFKAWRKIKQAHNKENNLENDEFDE